MEKKLQLEELEEIEICLKYLYYIKKALTHGQFLQQFQKLVEVVGIECEGLEDIVKTVLIRISI